jgi:hypothetical protein
VAVQQVASGLRGQAASSSRAHTKTVCLQCEMMLLLLAALRLLPLPCAAGGSGDANGADDDENGVEGDGEEGCDQPKSGVNSILSRVQRAVSKVRPYVGHSIWFDRGYGNMAAAQWLQQNGYGTTMLMMRNRIGLPRRFIKLLVQRLKCPRGCKHAASAVGCTRYSWTCLHKGNWELQLWCDRSDDSLVIALTDCTSAARTLKVTRQVDGKTQQASVPEGVGIYTTFARQASDGGDQLRKHLQLAARRQVRQGPKGGLFDAELGFANGSVIANDLRQHQSTTWDFAMEYYSDVINSVSMRRRMPAWLSAIASDAAAGATAAAAVERTRAQACRHRPRCFREDNKRKRSDGDDGGRHATVRGHVCAERCGWAGRPEVWCGGCERDRGRGNAWYHFSCFFDRHAVSFSQP